MADTSQRAADEFYPTYAEVMTRLGRERGWGRITRAQCDRLRGPHGSLLVGSPSEVVDKILYEHELFGHTRFLAQMDVGGQTHDRLMRGIERFGTRVAPEVRTALGIRAVTEPVPGTPAATTTES